MAIIRVHGQSETMSDPEAQVRFLKKYDIAFERWDVSKLGEIPEDRTPQEHILETFSEEVARLKRDRGYQTADVIALSPSTPNLDVVLKKFDREHLHTEDEVRFVVNGRGVFTIHNDEDDVIFDVEVGAGDLLVVPEGTWHWFELCEDRTIQCIRLFTNTEGWTPEYRG